MKKIFNFNCKVRRNERNYNAVAVVEVELTDDNVFTASANLEWAGKWFGMSGQCLDELKKYIHNDTYDTIYNMWKKHHLNDLHAGTVAQEEALEKAGYTGWANNYKECCDYLESIGLFDDNGYKFGHGWLKREIPDEDLNTIKELLK